jgi:hypothetical protein
MTPAELAIREEMERRVAAWLLKMRIDPVRAMTQPSEYGPTLCKCGCGERLPDYIARRGRHYKNGHTLVGRLLAERRTAGLGGINRNAEE